MWRPVAKAFRPTRRRTARTSTGWISASCGRDVSPVAFTLRAYNRLLPLSLRTASGNRARREHPARASHTTKRQEAYKPANGEGAGRCAPVECRVHVVPPGIRSDALPWPEGGCDCAGRPGAPQPVGDASGTIPDTRYSATTDDTLLDPRNIAHLPRRPKPGHSGPPRRTLRPMRRPCDAVLRDAACGRRTHPRRV